MPVEIGHPSGGPIPSDKGQPSEMNTCVLSSGWVAGTGGMGEKKVKTSGCTEISDFLVTEIAKTENMVVNAQAQNPNKPRIISEVKKSCLSKIRLGFTTSLQDFGKPKISGQLIWNVSPSKWHLRAAEVRNGSLFVLKNGSSGIEFRLPLRQLNLQPCSAPRTFCLTQGQELPLVTFQALTDEDYEKWVKVLAVELIRQTPLQDVRFLDIISITRKRESEIANMRRGRSEECLMMMGEDIWEGDPKRDDRSSDFSRDRRYRSLTLDASSCEQQSERRHRSPWNKYNFKDEVKKKVKKSERINEGIRESGPKINNAVDVARPADKTANARLEGDKVVSDESGISSGDENNNLIGDVKNENDDFQNFKFVSVMEKKKFFESLSSDAEGGEGIILTRSSSIGDLKKGSEENNKLRRRKRTKSLHDLSRTPVPVREICRLFEPQSEEREGTIEEEKEGHQEAPDQQLSTERNAIIVLNQRRLQRGERKLTRLRVQIAEVEETIKTIADDLKSIAKNALKRREGVEVYAALQRRLGEENSRLERLQEETSRVIKDNQKIIMKLKKYEEK